MKPERLELGALVEQFEVHNRSEGKSPKTVRWYNQALGIFQDWLQAEGMSTCLDDLGEEEARHFIIQLQSRPGVKGPASSNTVNNRVRALRAFFNWLFRKGYTETHRLENLKVPKGRQKEIEILTDDEIEKIFSSMNPDTVPGGRDTAIFSLMLDTGLRLSEVVTLKYDDVHMDTRCFKVLGKGDKERIVPFGTKCQRILWQYVQHFRVENPEEEADAFFLCINGNPLKADGLRALIKRMSKDAGVPRLHAHLIRHTYATRFLLNGGNVFLLQQNLGHTSLAMAQKYVHIASRMAALVSREFSPLDRFGMRGTRRLRHCFNGDGSQRKIYPNAGKTTQRRAVARSSSKIR